MKPHDLMVVLGLVLSQGAWAAQPLLKYECMFQAGHTTIVVMDDGTISHTEMPGHPPEVTVPESSLSGAELAELRQLIAAAQIPGSQYIRHNRIPLGLGQRIGTFAGYLNSKAVILMEVVRTQTDFGSAILNPSPAVSKLQQWVVTRGHAQNVFAGKY